MLQYITNTDCGVPVTEQIREVLAGGGRWIQIRMKEATDDEVRAVVEKVKDECLEKGAFLLLDDRVELAKTLEVAGVHLGKNDMPPSQARVQLGAAAVIGVTANTGADIMAVAALDIDYFGFGPFEFTTTKKNLAPKLGLEGLRELCKVLRDNQVDKPCVAVGGIRLDDVASLMETGVNGIAVSGAIAKAKDIAKETERFLEALKPFER